MGQPDPQSPIPSNHFEVRMGMFDNDVEIKRIEIPNVKVRDYKHEEGDPTQLKPVHRPSKRDYGGEFTMVTYMKAGDKTSMQNWRDKMDNFRQAGKLGSGVVMLKVAQGTDTALRWKFTNINLVDYKVSKLQGSDQSPVEISVTISYQEMTRIRPMA